jgi:hypothetical protein
VVVLETDPVVRKCVTKCYPDGRTLSLLVVEEKLIEMSLTYCWSWNYDRIREEKDKGANVRFKYWEKGGLDVGLTYFGTYLLGKMFTLNFEKVSASNLLRPEDWRDKVNNEISFPTVKIEKIHFEDGYSLEEKQNNYLRDIMFEDVIKHLVDHERKKDLVMMLQEDATKYCGSVGAISAVRSLVCGWLSEIRSLKIT